MKQIVVFASGTEDGGGSGFRQLVENSRSGVLNANIVAVVSQHIMGGVRSLAHELGIWFVPFVEPHTEDAYQYVVEKHRPNLIVLAGWIKLVKGIDFNVTPAVNIHPAPLPRFGGKSMFGLRVHKRVLKSGVSESAVTIHFVDDRYDAGDVIFECSVPVLGGDTPKMLQTRIQAAEHWYYGRVIDLILRGCTRVNVSDVRSVPE